MPEEKKEKLLLICFYRLTKNHLSRFKHIKRSFTYPLTKNEWDRDISITVPKLAQNDPLQKSCWKTGISKENSLSLSSNSTSIKNPCRKLWKSQLFVHLYHHLLISLFIFCIPDALTSWDLPDPGEAVLPRASQFLQVVNDSPMSAPFICKPKPIWVQPSTTSWMSSYTIGHCPLPFSTQGQVPDHWRLSLWPIGC